MAERSCSCFEIGKDRRLLSLDLQSARRSRSYSAGIACCALKRAASSDPLVASPSL
jgi:hypothetical protein